MHPEHVVTVDPSSVTEWYRRNRARSRAVFDLIDPGAYYSRPIALRNPVVFYEGHLPAFSVIALLRRGLGDPPVDERLEKLFERGIDPDTAAAAVPRSGASTAWPSRTEVLEFANRADAAMLKALSRAEFDDTRPAMQRAEALYTALEHEAMHQETLLYMWHRLPYDQKRKPAGVRYELGGTRLPSAELTQVPAGVATLGANRQAATFGWDNEFDEHRVRVDAFTIDKYDVTNADFLAFVEAGGYEDATLWAPDHFAWIRDEGVRCPAFWMQQ